eukprot:CAMPEP_0185824322 /NCGR_PEP_ID=MMETSP1322-20130828/29489_1 /TAXON_ID=265543 /ORGANISM="Minutocellus polymorphus, Strain RCC2270" /LENGTH=31 /DNA_ID= /DNA_START= /DNA_END= /DNA_ORIENTATION=
MEERVFVKGLIQLSALLEFRGVLDNGLAPRQ